MTKLAILEITDGTDTVSLLAGTDTGFHLRDWRPQIIGLKGGGIYQNSSIAPFRTLVFGVDETVSEAFDLKVNGYGQDDLIEIATKLVSLLVKARDYWLSDWQNTPVYLAARSPRETNTRYGLIRNFSMRELTNPYAAPFFNAQEIATLDELTLGIERDHWTANIPGTGTAVEIGATQAFDGRTLGRVATTSFEAFTANKHNVANLTDIYINDGGVFGSNLMDAALPYSLLPAVPAVGDIIYFGIDTSLIDSGPFASIVFDIGTAAAPTNGDILANWEYWNGAAWVRFKLVGQPFTLFDSTDATGGQVPVPWSLTGVNIAQWIIPTSWATTTVNGITGYWVRVPIGTVTNPFTAIPTQQNRQPYSVVTPYMEIDSVQAGGNVPALARSIAVNAYGNSASTLNNEDPGIWIGRVIYGLRSTLRGSSFSSYLNCSGEQEPENAYTTNPIGSSSSFTTDVSAPSGIRVTYNPTGLKPFTVEITITLSTPTDWLGLYHSFMRARQVGGNTGDIKVRLSIGLATGDVIFRTKEKAVLVLDDWQLVDMGILAIALGPLKTDDSLNTLLINIEIENTNAAPPDLYISDIILVPSDEWIGDYHHQRERDGDEKVLWALDVDPITFPKKPERAVYRRGNINTTISPASTNIEALPIGILNGSPILQANATQRLWYTFAQFLLVTGTHTGANNQATLTDAAADFVNQGVETGMTISNVTDGSKAEIDAVTATTITGTLLGGAGDDWDTNDVYVIRVTTSWISKVGQAAQMLQFKQQRYSLLRGDN